MTDYVNPSTRLSGAKQIIVPRRGSSGEMQEAPFDGGKYVRQNGIWVAESAFPEAPADGQQYVRKDGGWEPIPNWQSWTPVIKGTITDPTMGNSTLVGRYLQVGKTVSLRLFLQIGSTFNPGAGVYTIPTLPVAPRSDYWQPLLVAASLASPSGGDFAGVTKIEGSAGILRIHIAQRGTTVSILALGADNFSTGNRMMISGSYEAA